MIIEFFCYFVVVLAVDDAERLYESQLKFESAGA